MNPEIKPSSALIRRLSAIERMSGEWDRISTANSGISSTFGSESLFKNALAALSLDSSLNRDALVFFRNYFLRDDSTQIFNSTENSESKISEQHAHHLALLKNYLLAHHVRFALHPIRVQKLFHIITMKKVLSSEFDLEANTEKLVALRIAPGHFLAPWNSTELPAEISAEALIGGIFSVDEAVFPVVSPFIIEQRLVELLNWTKEELGRGFYHPLLVIGAFHLVFLHISPFTEANHRLSLLVLSHLLNANKYPALGQSEFVQRLAKNSRGYFLSLRQAEKSVQNNWTTLNAWLEFFLETLHDSGAQLLERTRPSLEGVRLTSAQKRIIETVRHHGTVTRETISTETGLNIHTVKYNLGVLSERGHLKREGQGRATSYRLV